jgi:hypothetical protein
MMWTTDEIAEEIDVVDHAETVIIVTTPAGVVSIMASVSIIDRVLRLDGVHVGGLKPGTLGRAGLNAIGYKLMELADVDEIVFQGSARTTGRNQGKVPRPIRFPRSADAYD